MPRQVTAFSNTTVKRLRSLRDKKARREEGLFLAEGLRILTEARESGRIPEYLFFARDSAGQANLHRGLANRFYNWLASRMSRASRASVDSLNVTVGVLVLANCYCGRGLASAG